eukprot:jgi/Bigna1/72611/fgenesh1_pg.20_\
MSTGKWKRTLEFDSIEDKAKKLLDQLDVELKKLEEEKQMNVLRSSYSRPLKKKGFVKSVIPRRLSKAAACLKIFSLIDSGHGAAQHSTYVASPRTRYVSKFKNVFSLFDSTIQKTNADLKIRLTALYYFHGSALGVTEKKANEGPKVAPTAQVNERPVALTPWGEVLSLQHKNYTVRLEDYNSCPADNDGKVKGVLGSASVSTGVKGSSEKNQQPFTQKKAQQLTKRMTSGKRAKMCKSQSASSLSSSSSLDLHQKRDRSESPLLIENLHDLAEWNDGVLNFEDVISRPVSRIGPGRNAPPPTPAIATTFRRRQQQEQYTGYQQNYQSLEIGEAPPINANALVEPDDDKMMMRNSIGIPVREIKNINKEVPSTIQNSSLHSACNSSSSAAIQTSNTGSTNNSKAVDGNRSEDDDLQKEQQHKRKAGNGRSDHYHRSPAKESAFQVVLTGNQKVFTSIERDGGKGDRRGVENHLMTMAKEAKDTKEHAPARVKLRVSRSDKLDSFGTTGKSAGKKLINSSSPPSSSFEAPIPFRSNNIKTSSPVAKSVYQLHPSRKFTLSRSYRQSTSASGASTCSSVSSMEIRSSIIKRNAQFVIGPSGNSLSSLSSQNNENHSNVGVHDLSDEAAEKVEAGSYRQYDDYLELEMYRRLKQRSMSKPDEWDQRHLSQQNQALQRRRDCGSRSTSISSLSKLGNYNKGTSTNMTPTSGTTNSRTTRVESTDNEKIMRAQRHAGGLSSIPDLKHIAERYKHVSDPTNKFLFRKVE